MNKIKLYGYDNCPYCQELKKLYQNDNLVFEYVDIELEENKAEFEKIMKIGKTDSVPVILVNKTILSPEISFKSIQEAFELTKKFINQ
jgi:glutaredoxin